MTRPIFIDLLSTKFPHFELREGQIHMFNDVLQAYVEEQTVLIEAGTGIGKSLAYLIPAMRWALEKNEPTVIATNTIALQEQLIQKDIPLLLETLDLNLKAVLVKGMNNYVCLRKLNDTAEAVPESVFSWAKQATEGSKSELPVLPSHDLWEQIGAEAESCTHVKCPYYKECFFFKARKNTADAHIIVANHHLFFADLAAREESENRDETVVLPPYNRVILDEAHHIEDVATQFFADHVSRRGLIHYLGRLFSDRATGKLVTLHKKICECYPEKDNTLLQTLEFDIPSKKRELVDLVNEAFETLSRYASNTHEEKFRLRPKHLTDPRWIENVQPAVQTLFDTGKAFLQSILLLEGQIKQQNDPLLINKCEAVLAEINGLCSRLADYFDTLHTFVFSPLETNRVRWIEENQHLISADLEISSRLSTSLFERVPTIVLCSATLTTNQEFTFVRKRLGIKRAEERIYESPFDYKNQAMLSVPVDLPDPHQHTFTSQAAERIWEIVKITQGGVFVLFTSYSMLKECTRLLASRLSSKNFFLLSQGEENRSTLLRKFRSNERAVLFGTDSFWEGVDVVGEALRCVVIVKLPFKVPSEPLFEARSESIAEQGGSPFADYSLPHAIVKFKQGFGRLIRTKEDRGCIICLDKRLVKKGYGKQFLKSLPPCPHVFENTEQILEDIKNFYCH